MVKSATMMMPCPWVNHAIDYVNKRNLSNIGIHLTFTSEWGKYRWTPITQIDKSSLIDPKTNYMWETSKQVEQNIKLEHAFRETEAQLKRALDAGIK
jgi:chitin disaccharide deacetylase